MERAIRRDLCGAGRCASRCSPNHGESHWSFGRDPRATGRGQDVAITLLGQLAGTSAELADILAPVYQVAAPLSADIQQLAYWDAQLNFLD